MKYLCWMGIVVCIAAMIAWSCTAIYVNGDGDITIEKEYNVGDVAPMGQPKE